jgi:hypothetical protein
MARAPLSFKKTDIVRASEATVAAGLKVRGWTIDRDGNLKVLTGEQAPEEEQQHSSNPVRQSDRSRCLSPPLQGRLPAEVELSTAL